MANVKFTARLRGAIDEIAAEESLGLVECLSGSLYSPVYRGGKYVWAKAMDSDGLLVTERQIHDGEGGAAHATTSLTLGVVVQSEDSTSQTKPNPLGKAAIGRLPYGIWVNTSMGRRRLDRVQVVFVLPKGVAPDHAKKFEVAKRNVENAADMMPDAITVEVPRGISQSALRHEVLKTVRPFLRGRGRPKGS